MTTRLLHRATARRLDGTGVPDHGVGDRAADRMTHSASGSRRLSQPSTRPAKSESPEPIGLTGVISGGIAR